MNALFIGLLIFVAAVIAAATMAIILVRRREVQKIAALLVAGGFPMPPACAGCGQAPPLGRFRFTKHTGLILGWYSKTSGGFLCEACAQTLYKSSQLHTALFGWWSWGSIVAGPTALAFNRMEARPLRDPAMRPPVVPRFPHQP